MKQSTPKPIRCAIYTRKSTEENLSLEFNSLDAQRESGEAYIQSQAPEGWICLPDDYSDGGFSGGNMERPALKRLLADIEAGRVDCVVVYKVDRLSRSLIDFAKIIETFNRHGVTFVSVTQQFNTATSAGRLMLNLLFTFAQFEREIVSERTRDKIAAARRKGKWSGGAPLLGFDIVTERTGSRLVTNLAEAEEVRRAYALYLEKGSLIPTVQALAAEGITTKKWITKEGKPRGGVPIDKTRLHMLLCNVIYLGKIRHHEEVYEGEHQAIIDERTWKKVQAQLQQNAVTGGAKCRNLYGATLRGLLYCGSCKTKMTHHYTLKRNVRYRYYVCERAQKRGWDTCATKTIPAREIESFVLNEIRAVGSNPEVCNATIERLREGVQASLKDLKAERGRLMQRSRRDNTALPKATNPDHLADLNERMAADTKRLQEINDEIARLEGAVPTSDQVIATLADFDAVWAALSPREQSDLIQLLVQRVEYDGPASAIDITYHPHALQLLQDEVGKRTTEAAA